MVLVFNFTLGKYLTLVFLFLNIFFSISQDIAESPKMSQCSTFPSFFFVLLYSVVISVIGIFCWSSLDFLSCVNLFIRMLHGLLNFSHRVVLILELLGDSCLEGLSITILKSTLDGLLEKPSMALLLTGVLSS